jgi:hypothetical protein
LTGPEERHKYDRFCRAYGSPNALPVTRIRLNGKTYQLDIGEDH